MAHLVVALVEALREHPIDVPHQQRQIGQQRLDHEVVVIAHQASGECAGVKPVQPRAQYIQQSPPVHIVHKDRLSPVPTRSHVINRAREFNAKRSCHCGRYQLMRSRQ